MRRPLVNTAKTDTSLSPVWVDRVVLGSGEIGMKLLQMCGCFAWKGHSKMGNDSLCVPAPLLKVVNLHIRSFACTITFSEPNTLLTELCQLHVPPPICPCSHYIIISPLSQYVMTDDSPEAVQNQ